MRLMAAQLGRTNKPPQAALWACFLVSLAPTMAHGQPYALTWSAHTAGGGRSADGGYVLIGAVGSFSADDLQMADSDVRFSLQYQGNGQVRIGYSTIRGDAPRSIALRVNLGSATLQSAADVIARDPAFNGFLDYIYTYPSGYTLGAGYPLAAQSSPGVPNFGSGLSQFALNMACFDPAGNQARAPASCANLITLQLHGSGTTTVTVGADTIRGGSYVEQGQTVNLPLWSDVTLP